MNTSPEVLLLNMPFGQLYSPSIGLALLQAGLVRKGISARTQYFTFRFADLIGEPLYLKIIEETLPSDLVGEWVFSRALFDSRDPAQAGLYVENILRSELEDRPHKPGGWLPPTEEWVSRILKIPESLFGNRVSQSGFG